MAIIGFSPWPNGSVVKFSAESEPYYYHLFQENWDSVNEWEGAGMPLGNTVNYTVGRMGSKKKIVHTLVLASLELASLR